MSSPEQRGLRGSTNGPPDELDGLLSRAVQDLAGNAKAPPQVWQRIEDTLWAGPSPARRRASRTVWRTGSLVQALALTSLLVVLGLSLGPALQRPLYFYGGGEQQEMLTRTPDAAPVPDSAPLLAEEGLLSGRQMLERAREQAHERQVMARDTSPSSDPILTHRQEWRFADPGR
jgi:hypothetical protein